MPGRRHADQIGLPVGGCFDNGFDHVTVADGDRDRMMRLAMARHLRRIAADMQQALSHGIAADGMGKCHDGADGHGRFWFAIDRDQHAPQMDLAACVVDEAAPVDRNEQGRRAGIASKLLGDRAVQPARGAMPAFGAEHDQIGRVLVEKSLDAGDRRLRR